MTKFVAQLNNSNYINIKADRLGEDKENNLLLVYNGNDLVACIDKSIILTGHLSECTERVDTARGRD
jgi:hypothetical protein